MREYNGKQIKYRAKQIVLFAKTAEGGGGHLNHFLPRNKCHKSDNHGHGNIVANVAKGTPYIKLTINIS